jgi:hypothetical protein
MNDDGKSSFQFSWVIKNVGDGACHFAILVNRKQNWGQKLCHLFRHTMATQIYTQVSIKALQEERGGRCLPFCHLGKQKTKLWAKIM